MTRYRKISVKIWGDRRFCLLSAPHPNAQTLWFYLLTGPHTSSLPCAFLAGEAALAEALGWPLKAFRKAFREVLDQGMVQADWKARLIFIPNGLAYNRPENPNVVIAWRKAFDELPECALKQTIFAKVATFLISEGFHESFRKAFGEAFHKDFANTVTETVTEAVTETETDTDRGASAPLVADATSVGPVSPQSLFNGYNQNRGPLPAASVLTKDRHRRAGLRCSSHAKNLSAFYEDFIKAVEKAAHTPFCCGEVQGHTWKANFDWFISNDTNYLRVLEGRYDGQNESGAEAIDRQIREASERYRETVRSETGNDNGSGDFESTYKFLRRGPRGS